MAEYIEREAVIATIEQAQEELKSNDDKMWNINKRYFQGLAWANRIVCDATAADVVEVVRCKDCKHARKMVSGDYACRVDHRIAHNETDYCSYGERREQ